MNDEINVKEPNVLLQLLIAMLMLPFNGWVIKLMWGWFIVPLGVMPVTIWHAIGLDALITYLTATIARKKVEGNFWVRMLTAFSVTLYFLLLSFIVHLFM